MKMVIRSQSRYQARAKMMKIVNNGDKKVYLVAQELRLAKLLADNNKTVRDKALKKLKDWFQHRPETRPFTEDDFQRIWKGLFYCMWMSDKPLIQEECAENISNLIHFPSLNDSLLFFKAGIQILINEWSGIDQLRLDKFLMLVRRLLRQMLIALKEHKINNKKNIENFNDVLSQTILSTNTQVPLGLFMHFIEIFLEELAKVTVGKIMALRVVDMLRPFIKKLATSDNNLQINHIKKFIFIYLIQQSDFGLQYQVKYEAWKKEGFPGSINSMQKIQLDTDEIYSEEERSENEAKEKPLDPRAGRVDVELPQIPFIAKAVADALREHEFDKNSTSKSRKIISVLARQFTQLKNGVYPLGITRLVNNKNDTYDTNIRKAAKRLIKFENKLLGKDKKRKRRGENAPGELDVSEKRRKIEEGPTEDNKVNNKKVTNNKNETLEEDLKKGKVIIKKKIKSGTNKKITNILEEKMANKPSIPIEKSERKTKKVDKKVMNNKKEKTDEKLEKFIEKTEGKTKEKAKSGVGKKVKIDKNDKMKEELAKFIEKSEGKIEKKIKMGVRIEKKIKKKKTKKNQKIIDNIECVFERNSGTWVVYDLSGDKEENEIPSQQTECPDESLDSGLYSPSKTIEIPSISSESPKGSLKSSSKIMDSPSKSSGSPSKLCRSPSRSKESPEKRKESPVRSVEQNDSPKSGFNPVKLFESPPQEKDLFPKSAWDEPLQEGEYEICIPSKKYVGKMKKLAKKKNRSIHELINTTEKIKVKSRLSLDSSLVKNPYSTPTSTKKVKINTKLNMSQEVHEHHAQILSSPGIPYDANKKPSKPLLKSSFSSTPINPFYNKQLNVW